ncbi:MAG TPA: hypothetical protein VGF20_08485, partial [Candidatus Acidoferrum sp.]
MTRSEKADDAHVRATRRATASLMVGNCVLWLVWIANFVLLSKPYEPHIKMFDEHSPPYIFWGRAFPLEAYAGIVMQAVKSLERPSFYAAIPVNYFFSSRGIFVDHLYWGVSVGGYYLIAVFLLSFLQWYLVDILIDYLRQRLRTNRG